MRNDRLDLTLLLEVLQAPPRERAVDLHSVDEGGDCDETVGLDILVELLGSGLVKQDGVLGLVLDCIGDCNVSQELSYGDDENLLRGKQKATGKIVCVCNLPFPLDHFFFCFFAPVAAGAILTDLLFEMGRFGLW